MFPKPIYEILPYAYLLIGVFGLEDIRHKICLSSGLPLSEDHQSAGQMNHG